MSEEGIEKLKEELNDLKTVRRRELAKRIEEAKALGDLSENAEYHEAKDELGFVEGRILEIEDIMKNVAVIEHEKGEAGVVHVGSTVVLETGGKEKTYTIVGSNEANPIAGKISNESPIGEALLGKREGDEVTVEAPGGMTVYKIKKVT